MKTKLLFFATMLTCMLLSPGKIHASDMPDAVCSNEIAAMHRPTHDIDRFIKRNIPVAASSTGTMMTDIWK